tara:strand:+ start:3003 stop:3839 length:837 start_codon:yes stop_codon:yes gene_type:complete
MKNLLFIVVLLFTSVASLAGEIVFITPKMVEKKFQIEELKKKVPFEKVQIYNFKTRVFEHYNAFSVRDLLPFISGEKGISGDLFITSKNGYKPFIRREHLLSEAGYFAFERIGGKMNTIDHLSGNLVDTGPLYLIWLEQKKKDESKGLRWVYQVERLTYNLDESFKEVLPEYLPSSVRDGAVLYQSHCMRCHHKEGITADLTSPSILYRMNAKELTEYIYNPKKLNPKSTMPGFKQVLQSENDTKFIIEYLNYRKNPDSAEYKPKKINKAKELKKVLD